jgi:hypothetical protein
MMTQFTQNKALLGSWLAINCYKLSQISIELLHFHYTHSVRAPPPLEIWEAATRDVYVTPHQRHFAANSYSLRQACDQISNALEEFTHIV